MTDRRRYTSTKALQAGWTASLIVFVALAEITGLLPTVITVGAAGVCWIGGLIALGLRERRHWNDIVAASSFDPSPSGHTADLQQIILGKSVTVSTAVSGLLTPEQTTFRAPVEGVDASFTVRIVDEELAADTGLTTGVDTLDERFVITGAEENVAALLTEEVRDALLSVDAPGTYTIMPDRVVFVVPFTRLRADELAAAGEAVAVLARQLETVGQQ